jgi:hypothetical protein
MTTVFFSYSHEDEELRNRVEKHLAMLKHEGLLQTWHDRRLAAGSDLDQGISQNLEAADVILLLVSADFLASPYCYSREMARAMERHHAGQAVVVPVIVKPCDWHRAPFGKLLAVPRDGKAVTLWANHEEAFADVAVHLRTLLEKKFGPVTSVTPKATGDSRLSGAASSGTPRSSNLRLKKEFTQRDHDVFLHESFEFFAQFFEGSLAEMQQRNPGVETTYRRIDANAFTAVIYRNGTKVSECAIRLNDFFGNAISFSHDANPRGNGFNESLSAIADEQVIYFVALGFGRGGGEKRMSVEAAAEHLWAMLIERLQ